MNHEFLTGEAGCLAGSTKVFYKRLARKGGRWLPLEKLYYKFNDVPGHGLRWTNLNEPTYLPSFAADGTVFYNQIEAVYQSGVKATARVLFVDGSFIVATWDHPLAIPGGKFICIADLHPGENVLAKGSMLARGVGDGGRQNTPPRVIENIRYYPMSSFHYVNGYAYKRVNRARLVVEAQLNNLPYAEFGLV